MRVALYHRCVDTRTPMCYGSRRVRASRHWSAADKRTTRACGRAARRRIHFHNGAATALVDDMRTRSANIPPDSRTGLGGVPELSGGPFFDTDRSPVEKDGAAIHERAVRNRFPIMATRPNKRESGAVGRDAGLGRRSTGGQVHPSVSGPRIG